MPFSFLHIIDYKYQIILMYHQIGYVNQGDQLTVERSPRGRKREEQECDCFNGSMNSFRRRHPEFYFGFVYLPANLARRANISVTIVGKPMLPALLVSSASSRLRVFPERMSGEMAIFRFTSIGCTTESPEILQAGSGVPSVPAVVDCRRRAGPNGESPAYSGRTRNMIYSVACWSSLSMLIARSIAFPSAVTERMHTAMATIIIETPTHPVIGFSRQCGIGRLFFGKFWQINGLTA